MKLSYQNAEVSFRKIKDIGEEGTNSTVFLVHDQHLDANLAIKQIKTDGFNEESYLAEAQALYASSHPNVVQVLYACRDGKNIYIAMPFFENGSLKSLVQKNNLTARQLIRYSIQFLSGLNNMHSKGLLHFDIKADNILISDRNEALISDFGLAKNTDEHGFATPDGAYTPHTPPEAICTDDLDNRSDIYQVGLTIYRIFAGDNSLEEQRSKFKTGADFSTALRRETYPDLNLMPLHTPKKIKKIIKKCTRYQPEKRYESVIDLLNDLSSIDPVGLDWEFTSSEEERNWVSHTEDGYMLRLKVSQDGSCTATKTKGSGEPRRVSALCKHEVDDDEIHTILFKPSW